jgi:hypothetical protein
MIEVPYAVGQRLYFGIRLPDDEGNLVNLTGWSARAELRAGFDTTVLATLSTANGYLRIGNELVTLEGVVCNIELDVPGSATAGWAFDKAYTDIKLIQPDGSLYRWLRYAIVRERSYTV